ncbi:hypothetical protein U6A24_00615 [Aquimarina gracilis]|uniref:Uncharacterized protein n=1 Tax=Aquimarina gracilis TaxID=874422 RepID=A0ABU5ZQT2_9FLAO|nr:hypothetical protein [Aquimarina gracilis]MEB3343937.1 hypothetical protein [Aquimarina gracilis]
MIYTYLILADSLNKKGFSIGKKELSENFGNFQISYSDKEIELTFKGDKSFFHLDINRCDDEKEKFDLLLVKTLIQDDKNRDLTKVESFEELCHFINVEIDKILVLFSSKMYPKTKEALKLLEYERSKKMFDLGN